MKASGSIINDMDAAVVVTTTTDPQKGRDKRSTTANSHHKKQQTQHEPSPTSEDGDVTSKLSDLSETSSIDDDDDDTNGTAQQQRRRHDDMMMMDTTGNNNNINNNGIGGNANHSSSATHHSNNNKNRHKLRSERSEDYENFEKMLRNKHSKACKAMSAGAYRKALTDFESILSDLLGRYGERHERVGSALHNVAIANLRAGSLDDAMDAIEEAIKIRSRSLGRQHPRVADSLVELGIILLSMDEHDDALKVFDRALKLRREEKEDVFAEEDIDECKLKIAKVLNNIGCVNFEKGDLQAAEFAFNEAIVLQRSVFKNWFAIVCGVDANSPGILTMASTMCNKAYVEIERDHFVPAIDLFNESLKIQRSVLGDDNKLVQSSLDNLGYAHAMLGKYEKALIVFTEVWNAIKDSNDFPEEKAVAVRKVLICHARLEQWNKVFPLLEIYEDIQHEINAAPEDLQVTRQLMGEVNYQLMKLPSLSDATNRALGCAVCMGDPEDDVKLDHWIIDKPENTSKMSGHRVTHA